MRLFRVMILLAAVLDIAMCLQSPSSALSSTSPRQVIGYTADNADAPLIGIKRF